MILGYKLYQLLYIFAACAVLGYLTEQFLHGFTGRIVKRGVMKGPYGLIYGLEGVAAALFGVLWNPGVSPGELTLERFRMLAASLVITAVVLVVLSVIVMRFISGMNLYGFNLLIILVLSVLGVTTSFVGITLFRQLELLPTWGILLVLLVFYVPFLWDLMGTGFRLYGYRWAMEQVEFLPDAMAEFELLETEEPESEELIEESAGSAAVGSPDAGGQGSNAGGQGSSAGGQIVPAAVADPAGIDAAVQTVADGMKPYRRWLRAYPRFYKRTAFDMEKFLGENLARHLMRRILT